MMIPTLPDIEAGAHELVDGTLYREDGGIIGRCKCGWTTGHRFSSFAASAAFMDHQETMQGQSS